MRAAIYARYSTDMQRQESIEDQAELCRRVIRKNGWSLVEEYADPALSGSNAFRPGLQRMLSDARSGRFDVVVCEAIDRLSRNLADVAKLFDDLTFHRVQIHTTAFGLVTQMHVGVMGMMAQMQLSDIREKTRRGLAGRVRQGKSAGGLAYGYAAVPPKAGTTEAGDRTINQAEAMIVQRIFREYAGGMPPRQIAATLNAEVVPGPGGRLWGDTTIRGQPDRGTGILNNTLYIGQLTWNACSYVKNPTTGKRVARVNPLDQREVTAVPDLRIIDDTLWQRVKARQSAVRTEMARDCGGNALNRAHRRKFLLSGLLECGCCGATYAVRAKDRYGCANHRSNATCTNAVTIDRQAIEERVLAALKNHLLTPELVALFVTKFQEAIAIGERDAGRQQAQLKDQLASANQKFESIMRAIENGAWNTALGKRLDEIELQRKSLRQQLATGLISDAGIVRLHPNAAATYAAQVGNLQEELEQPGIRAQAIEAIRLLIQKIILTPDDNASDGLAAELYGDLAMILNLAASPTGRSSGFAASKNPRSRSVPEGLLSVVAGVGFEPTTFRL